MFSGSRPALSPGVTEERLDDYRQLFSIVFSGFFLFEELLGLERPDLDDAARRAARPWW